MLLSLPHLYITSVNQLVQSLLPPTCPSSQSLPFLDTTSACVWTPWLINSFRAGLTLSSLPSSNVPPRNGKIYFSKPQIQWQYSPDRVWPSASLLGPQPHFPPRPWGHSLLWYIYTACWRLHALSCLSILHSHFGSWAYLLSPSLLSPLRLGVIIPSFCKTHWLHFPHPTPYLGRSETFSLWFNTILGVVYAY